VARPIIEPFQPVLFDGGDATDCTLVDGPVMDLNLMERGVARTLDLRFMAVAAEGECSVTGALAVVVVAGTVVAGAVMTGGGELGVLDAVIGSSPAIKPMVFAGGSDGAVLAVVGSVR
jgi:environmental stress-induced protein Ves